MDPSFFFVTLLSEHITNMSSSSRNQYSNNHNPSYLRSRGYETVRHNQSRDMLPYKDPYEGDVDSEYGSQSCACTITRRFNFTGLHWFSLVFTGFRKLIQPKPPGDTQPPPVTISLRMLCHTGATTNQSLRASMIPVVKLVIALLGLVSTFRKLI